MVTASLKLQRGSVPHVSYPHLKKNEKKIGGNAWPSGATKVWSLSVLCISSLDSADNKDKGNQSDTCN